ncbi:MAG: EAL domain-containing protein [Methylococcaceae bacterium]|nr:EAL domain-containing protein [Methylococcaceae bacterium]
MSLSKSGNPMLTRLFRLVFRQPGWFLGFMGLIGLALFLAYAQQLSNELIGLSAALMFSLLALILTGHLVGKLEAQLSQRQSDLQSEIDRHKQTGQALEKSESRCRQAKAQLRLAASVFESSHEGIMITDPNHRILKVNAGFTLITGYRAEEVVGSTPRFLHSDQHSVQYFDDLNGELKTAGHWEGELWSRRKDGAYFTEWLSISAVTDDEGRVSHYVGILSDISERKLSEEKILHMAQYDSLTGLPNRILLQDRLEVLLAHLNPGRDGYLAVLFIDLDDFKLINDSLGHDYGDILLKNIAKRLSENLRKEDTVARLGGDEFVVLLKDFAHREQVATVAHKLVEAVAKPVVINEMEMRVTCSIGISIFPEDGRTPIELMKNADTAMYHAKAKGRNNCQYFDLALNEAVHRRLILENSLRQALEERQLQLYYQPQIELSSGEIAGCEAIVHWKHPEWGFISPAEFMSVAEESGLSLPLGDWVLHTALRQVRRWQDMELLFAPVSFILSPAQFAQENLGRQIMTALEQANVEPCYLELELAENLAMKDINKTTKLLHEFRDLGVRLAISHFGIGYSSLSFLKRLHIDKLKIDRSFVSDLDKNTEGQEIVYAIIQLAYSLHIEIAAEGVDTIGQLEQLQRLRCQIAQGMVFTPAIPAGQFTALLEACKPEPFLKKSEPPQ